MLDYKTKQVIGVSIMLLGILIEIISVFCNYPQYWDAAILIFLLGIMIESINATTELKKYKIRYGEL